VLRDIDRVRAAGFREIALTGVHLGSYGRDWPRRSSLINLLKAIEQECAGQVRVRISSLEPMDCGDDVIDVVASSKCFAPHFHLPLQHASDRMLVAMRRPYTIAYYRRLVDRIHEWMPHASIGSDVIVGFPGESDEDFAELEEYLSDAPLSHLHVFPYSDRPGTAASAMSGKVHGSIVRERARRVRAIGAQLADNFRRSQDGAVRPALTIDDGSTAVTDNYLKVEIGPGYQRNEWLSVRVHVTAESLFGEVLAEPTTHNQQLITT
jgi:threonylcarbamoyladenosine tRNA methylthiotransferase MtaB